MTAYSNSYANSFPFADRTVQFGLTALTALSYTVPGDSSHQYRAKFSFADDSKVWVGYNVTATLPTIGTLTQNSSIELNPGKYDGDARYVRGGDVLSFISTAQVTDVGISLLELPRQL